MKICSKCGIEKPLEDFKKNKSCLSGRAGVCKKCRNKRERENHKPLVGEAREKHKLAMQKWHANNKEKDLNYRKEYYNKNRDKIKEYNKEKWQKVKDDAKRKEQHAKASIEWYYRNKNTEKYQEYKRKKDSGLNHRIAQALRARLRSALKKNYKQTSAVQDLGCSILEFKKYIEHKWLDGMSWDNWGFGVDKWHIDHIVPLANFDLTNKKQSLRACHYTNLQPLWQPDNLSKGKRPAV